MLIIIWSVEQLGQETLVTIFTRGPGSPPSLRALPSRKVESPSRAFTSGCRGGIHTFSPITVWRVRLRMHRAYSGASGTEALLLPSVPGRSNRCKYHQQNRRERRISGAEDTTENTDPTVKGNQNGKSSWLKTSRVESLIGVLCHLAGRWDWPRQSSSSSL